MAKRFLVLSDDDLDIRTKKNKNENTLKAERKADKAFTNFLIAMGVPETDVDLAYWNYTEPELDKYLAKFWFSARKSTIDTTANSEEDPDKKQQLYKANTLRNFQYSINRILKTKGHLYDITDKKTTSFTKSQRAFNDAIKELKAEGKGDVDSYPEIIEEG